MGGLIFAKNSLICTASQQVMNNFLTTNNLILKLNLDF
jgi:hypothetical protein